MRSWHIAFLGRREFPADLTEFELAFFFSYSNAEHSAIASRRGESLGATRMNRAQEPASALA